MPVDIQNKSSEAIFLKTLPPELRLETYEYVFHQHVQYNNRLPALLRGIPRDGKLDEEVPDVYRKITHITFICDDAKYVAQSLLDITLQYPLHLE
jgi:hypothetical protein